MISLTKKKTYFLYCVLHHISNDGDCTSLTEAQSPSDCLGFYGRVPLGFKQVDTRRCGEIEAVQSATSYDGQCENGSLLPYSACPSCHQQQFRVWIFLESLDDPVAFYG